MALFYWPKAEKARTSAQQAVLGRGIARGWSRCHGKPSISVASCAALKRPRPRPATASEPSGLEPLAVQDQAGPVVDQDLHPVAPPGAEDEDLARERVGPQRLLHQGGQAVHALPEVDRPGRQQDAHPRRDRDHASPRTASSTRRSAAASTSAPTRTTAGPSAISIRPAGSGDVAPILRDHHGHEPGSLAPGQGREPLAPGLSLRWSENGLEFRRHTSGYAPASVGVCLQACWGGASADGEDRLGGSDLELFEDFGDLGADGRGLNDVRPSLV